VRESQYSYTYNFIQLNFLKDEENAREVAVLVKMIPRLLRSSLKLRHLQLLVTLDQMRHLGRTAEALSLSAPAISKSLNEIERMVGYSLFVRSTRGTEPTDHGAVVIDFAKRVLADYTRAEAELEAVSAGSVGRTHVGAMVAAIPTLLVPAIDSMKREAPRSTVLIEEGDLRTLFKRLRQNEVDFLVGRVDPNFAGSDLCVEPLFEQPSCCVVHVSNRLARQEQVELADLVAHNWIIPQPWATLRPQFENMFRATGLSIPVDVIETASFITMLSALRLRGAVTLLPKFVAQDFEREGFLKVLPMTVPFDMPPLGIIALNDHCHSPAANLLLKHLRIIGRQFVSSM
jgi:DNA-binding transcriptional LysR family regulator